MSQKFLNLVKTQIFYEFSKLASLRARPNTQENRTSDVSSSNSEAAETEIEYDLEVDGSSNLSEHKTR